MRGVTGEETYIGTGKAAKTIPAPTTAWITGTFTTMAKAVDAEAPVVITPAPPAKVEVVQVPVPGPAQAIPTYLLWVIVAIGAALIIALIVLIVRTRRIA